MCPMIFQAVDGMGYDIFRHQCIKELYLGQLIMRHLHQTPSLSLESTGTHHFPNYHRGSSLPSSPTEVSHELMSTVASSHRFHPDHLPHRILFIALAITKKSSFIIRMPCARSHAADMLLEASNLRPTSCDDMVLLGWCWHKKPPWHLQVNMEGKKKHHGYPWMIFQRSPSIWTNHVAPAVAQIYT